jgi:hypothetical protein
MRLMKAEPHTLVEHRNRLLNLSLFGALRGRAKASGGDTIVEVMIVLAVLGLAFGISYATANHGLAQSQNSEEHSSALGVLDSQVELLSAAMPDWSAALPSEVTNANGFCMVPPSGSETRPGAVQLDSASPASAGNETDFREYPASCQSATGVKYYESIIYNNDTSNPQNSYFDFRVRWPGLGSFGVQQEEINYKIFQIANIGSGIPPTGGGGGTGTGGGPQLTWDAVGSSFSACQSQEPPGFGSCLTTGTAAYSYTGGSYGYEPYKLTYDINNGLEADNQYDVSLNYSNFSYGLPVPPSYEYSVNIYINGIKILNKLLPATSTGSNTISFPVTTAGTITPTSITVEWINDYFTTNADNTIITSDANFQLNSLGLTAK